MRFFFCERLYVPVSSVAFGKLRDPWAAVHISRGGTPKCAQNVHAGLLAPQTPTNDSLDNRCLRALRGMIRGQISSLGRSNCAITAARQTHATGLPSRPTSWAQLTTTEHMAAISLAIRRCGAALRIQREAQASCVLTDPALHHFLKSRMVGTVSEALFCKRCSHRAAPGATRRLSSLQLCEEVAWSMNCGASRVEDRWFMGYHDSSIVSSHSARTGGMSVQYSIVQPMPLGSS